jgi:hypothetical protein
MLSPYGSSLSLTPFPVPNSPMLISVQVNFQAVGFAPGSVDLSNAVVAVLGY